MAILVQSNKKPSVSFPSQTGSIVTFNSQFAGLPLKSCKVDIPVTQEGTGYPSPDNVRNFVGVDSLDFSATGKNLLRMNRSTVDENGVTFTVNEDFSITTSGEYQGRAAIFITSYLVTLRAGTYTFTGCPSGGSYSDYVLRLENSSNVLIALDTGNGRTFTLTEDQPVYCRIYIYSQNGVGKTFYPMVRLVDSNSNYEPFGDNKLFTFGQTIYAGELDVLMGVLTVTHKAVDLGSLSWERRSHADYYYFRNLTNIPNIKSGITYQVGDIRCSIYEAVQSGFSADFVNYKMFLWTNGSIYLRNDDYTDANDFKTAMNGVLLVYELATPEVINLGGMDISTLQGENNLFASTGETTVQYIKIGG